MKLVGERRALSAIIFAFYFLIFLLVGLNPELPPGFDKAFFGLASVYGLAFFSLVAGYFWARWYSVGLGLFGLILAAVGTWQAGEVVFQFAFLGLTHLAAIAMLWGQTMSETYDGQTAWREKLHMDENAVQRLGRSVIRAGVSLPFVLLYALVPRANTTHFIFSIGALVMATLGMRALVRLKTWGVLAMGVAGAMMLVMAGSDIVTHHHALGPALGGSLLIFAAVPWLRPAAAYLRV